MFRRTRRARQRFRTGIGPSHGRRRKAPPCRSRRIHGGGARPHDRGRSPGAGAMGCRGQHLRLSRRLRTGCSFTPCRCVVRRPVHSCVAEIRAAVAIGWTEGQVDVSDSAVQTDDVAAEYVARVERDLADNAEEQERIGREIEAMRQRLDRLRRNHAVLMGVRSALIREGGQETAQAASPVPADSSAPTQGTTIGEHDASGRAATRGPRGGVEGAKPTLVDLVCSHLSGQSEPRSAVEVTEDIARSHPDRQAKITVVRATLESLVAQGRVRRSKQGRSVFYSSTTQSAPSTG